MRMFNREVQTKNINEEKKKKKVIDLIANIRTYSIIIKVLYSTQLMAGLQWKLSRLKV